MRTQISTILIVWLIAPVLVLAQDYLISFSGTGETPYVTTVIVENLTQNKTKTVNGTDILHLLGVVTGIETISYDVNKNIFFYPNPMEDYTKLQFDLPESGKAVISLTDLAGRNILRAVYLLDKGIHSYLIRGVKEGTYIAKISLGRHSLSSRLVSLGSENGAVNIIPENSPGYQGKQIDSKSASAEVVMQYTTGDRLKLTSISGNYSSVVTDVPAASKTITFNFVACTDPDGNNYQTVTIGSQTWQAQNLRTTKLNDGAEIQLINNDAEWAAITSPALGWYNNNAATYKDLYGGYYNWYAINTGKLCPAGWRVPNNTDWNTLFSSLGGANVAGGRLKATGTTFWNAPNTGATNESGFTGLAGSTRSPSGAFSLLKYIGTFWTTTQADQSYGFFKQLQFDTPAISEAGQVKTYGRNVRCVKE